MTEKHTPPLPPFWQIQNGYLHDHDKYARHILDDSGKIDRLKIAIILDNHGMTDFAAAWRGLDSRLSAAAPELLAACGEIVRVLNALGRANVASDWPVVTDACQLARAAIAQATGVQR